jgi:hypothetical protein
MHYQFHPNCTEHALATGETRTASLGGTCSEEFLDHVQTSMVPENEKPKINGKKMWICMAAEKTVQDIGIPTN